jgi:hypothetical protein
MDGIVVRMNCPPNQAHDEDGGGSQHVAQYSTGIHIRTPGLFRRFSPLTKSIAQGPPARLLGRNCEPKLSYTMPSVRLS